MQWNQQATEPNVVAHLVRILGANGAGSIDTDGGGYDMTLARTGEGAYTLTWGGDPGEFQGWSPGFGAATPANLAGYSVVRDTYASKVLAFIVYDELFAPADLVADEYLDLVVYFKG